MGKFRFIHAADIHLGSILHINGATSPALKQYSSEGTYMAFERLCNYAIDFNAKFILISGDLYDRESRSVRANRFFFNACERLNKKGIRVFIIAGNHDPIREHQEMFTLPDNVHIFGSEKPEIFYVQDGLDILAAIVGQSYKTKWEPSPLHRKYPAPDRGVFNIGLLHTQMNSNDKKYLPCTISELLDNTSIDYWALGHIHKPDVLKEQKPVIAYAGIPQGRDFGELGQGGCWLVEVNDTDISNMHYLITSPVIYKSFSIDISCDELREAEGLNQLEEYIADFAQKMINESAPSSNKPDGYIIRWNIIGPGKLHYYLSNDRQGYERELADALRTGLSDLDPFIWTDSVEIRTKSPVTEDILQEHAILKDLLEQSIYSISMDDNSRKSLIKELGQVWTTSDDYEDRDDKKLTLDDETLLLVLEEAKQLLIESLASGGEK